MSTNTARSSGERLSSTTIMAYETDSAISTSSAAPGAVTSGSGSHGPTYASRWTAAELSRFSARLVTVRARKAPGLSTRAVTWLQRSQLSCTRSSASATLPSIR